MIDAAGLRVMKAIADEGSFTSAANALGFTQPAISQMVRRLRAAHGHRPRRTLGRQVRPAAGQVLARHAVGVLAALDAAEEEITAIAGLRAGRVRLQAFPSSSATLVPKALAILRSRHPDITMTFTEAEPPQSLAALRAGDCDVAVIFATEDVDAGELEEDLSLLVTRHLLDDELRLATPKDHPLAQSGTASLSDFASEDWIAGCPRCTRPPRRARRPRRLPAHRLLRDRGLRRAAGSGHRRTRGVRAGHHPRGRQARRRRDAVADSPLAAPDPRGDSPDLLRVPEVSEPPWMRCALRRGRPRHLARRARRGGCLARVTPAAPAVRRPRRERRSRARAGVRSVRASPPGIRCRHG